MSQINWYDIIDGTWPAAAYHQVDGWTVCEGRGGGKRVSAASGSGDIELAEAKLAELGQQHLFMIREGDDALDADLADRGYDIIDPVVLYAKALPGDQNQDWESAAPTDASVQTWAAGGIGPDRLAVMDRAQGPKTVVQADGGCGFVACHDGIAMIHALEVAEQSRGQGIGSALEKAARAWAPARKIAALTVETNTASRGLFEKAGYCLVSRYHYRIRTAAV